MQMTGPGIRTTWIGSKLFYALETPGDLNRLPMPEPRTTEILIYIPWVQLSLQELKCSAKDSKLQPWDFTWTLKHGEGGKES